LLAALCTQKLAFGNFRICRLFSSWTTLLGVLLGFGITLASVVVLPVLVLLEDSPRALHWSVLVTPAAYGLNWSTFLGGPINEEPGWRGFALPRLQAHYGPLSGTLFLGMLWGCWHLPLFLVRGWSNFPVWAYVVLLVSFSVLMTLVSNFSGSSIVVPMVMHATFNTSAQLLTLMTEGAATREPWVPFFIAPICVIAVAAILLTRGRLFYHRAEPAQPPASS
jgi:CAAX protease family protein